VLGDLLPLIPSDGRTYLLGVVSTPEDVQPSFALDQFQPIRIGHAQVELRYATRHDLQAAHLDGLYVTEGEILLRTLLPAPRAARQTGREPSRRPPSGDEIPKTLVHSEAPRRTVSLTVRRLRDPQELLVHPEQTVTRGQPLADLRSSRRALLLKQRVAQAKSRAAHAVVERLQLTHQQTLALKRTEDALAGIHRNLAGLQAQQTQELAQAQAQVEAAGAQLDALTHALAATIIRSPVAGRILSVRLQHEAAFLRILTDD
jgi:biotin carboxyl carrier protein